MTFSFQGTRDRKTSFISVGSAVSLALLATTLSACNVFSGLDSPSGDAQILSAARACFDQGDFACARDNYSKLSDSSADIRASEEAFLALAENGATMAAFMETFGSGGGGSALNDLAVKMAPGSVTKRVAIQNAFKKYTEIQGNPSLKALVRFIGSVALASEFLAEEMGAATQLNKARVVSNPTACATATGPGCASEAGCGAPTSPVITDSNPVAVNFLSDDISGTLHLGHLKQAITEMQSALSNLGASGSFGAGAGDFSNDVMNQALGNTAAEKQCFRKALLDLGIGN